MFQLVQIPFWSHVVPYKDYKLGVHFSLPLLVPCSNESSIIIIHLSL